MTAAQWATEQMHHGAMIDRWERETRAKIIGLADEDGTIDAADAIRCVHEEAEVSHVLDLLGDGWEYNYNLDAFRRYDV